ncbi:MAG: hypothetical protein ACKVOH_02925 [Chlamydiales bacterium]
MYTSSVYLDGVHRLFLIYQKEFGPDALPCKRELWARVVAVPISLIVTIDTVVTQVLRGVARILGTLVYQWDKEQFKAGCRDLASASIQILVIPLLGLALTIFPVLPDSPAVKDCEALYQKQHRPLHLYRRSDDATEEVPAEFTVLESELSPAPSGGYWQGNSKDLNIPGFTFVNTIKERFVFTCPYAPPPLSSKDYGTAFAFKVMALPLALVRPILDFPVQLLTWHPMEALKNVGRCVHDPMIHLARLRTFRETDGADFLLNPTYFAGRRFFWETPSTAQV